MEMVHCVPGIQYAKSGAQSASLCVGKRALWRSTRHFSALQEQKDLGIKGWIKGKK